VGVGIVVLALAVTVLAAIVVRHPGWAAVAYAVGAIARLAFLVWAPREWQHSDGKPRLRPPGRVRGLFRVALSFEPRG